MGILDTSLTEISKTLGKKISYKELEDILFDFGIDVKGFDGENVKVELTPDRYDMLSVQGLGRAFRAYIEIETGLPKYKVVKHPSFVKVENPIEKWPSVVAFAVRGLKFDDEKIKEIIQIQEKIGDLLLKKRKKGGIGIYPLEKIKFPVIFTARKLDEIVFRPLEFDREITGRQILSQHPTGRKYAHILEGEEKYPLFVDSAGTIMSMPPIINSHLVGKIDEHTKDIFFEATGPNLVQLKQVANIFAAIFADMGGEIYSLDIKYSDKIVICPDVAPIKRKVSVKKINQLLGINVSSDKVKELLKRMLYDIVEAECSEDKITVLAPFFRTDLWHEIDVIDDVGRAYKYDNIKPTFPNISTVGKTLPKSDFGEKIAEIFVGLGFQETVTYISTSRQNQYKQMNIEKEPHVSITNATENTINSLRTWIIPELFKVLKNNQHHQYPQKIFEVGFVVIPDENVKDVLCRDVRKASCLIANTNADFNQAKQNLDALLRLLGVDYKVLLSEHLSFDAEKQGKIIVKDKEVGIIGEFNKKVLENWGIKVPVAGFELNIDEIFDLSFSK
ncbi:MAG: phenylalanine--tRNA ligase subunit beta [Candidatus Huberarchaeum crystalense]|uniref:phenylalanine--tRNA ligase n=1 Tax=Huberarchaeum crystalense TaxID=2014257 RepID=A0A2G9LIS8_HUBC1|nr:phenylalanine--tRNA ligase subunit beta [archaeon]OIP20306.1 MAG: phenylalanine--tRNA ligase subunit beta [archaeon CG2_30_31_98]PIN66447.1 MAG: phenylalanine--tRNA ligase subunit beta [Candidatus Huberarchaeum crystalense]NCS98157.1 phenylalanine--tRNA ligase subunit beta [archaeon]PIV13717.1 MAG: phenylalanine--tRNA ligase subunit beta [Candidatus Huberarchaeum crystalense]